MVICKRLLNSFNSNLKRWAVFVLLIIIFLLSNISVSTAQLNGVYTIGANQTYPSIDSVLRALNQLGVSGAVTIQIPSGYSEQTPIGGFRLGSNILNNSLSVSSSLSFQKIGNGTNPIIYSNAGSIIESNGGLSDIIWAIEGVDYVRIKNIDIIDTNTNNSVLLSNGIGIGFFKFFDANTGFYSGCQHNQLIGCRIFMQGTLNENSIGVSFDNRVINNANKIKSNAPYEANSLNTIKGCYFANIANPIYFNGNSASNMINWDQFNEVGGNAIGEQNQIFGWGSGNSTNYAVYFADQLNGKVVNNQIENLKTGTLGSNAHLSGNKYGIYLTNTSNTYNDLVNHLIRNNSIVWVNGLGNASFTGIYSHYNGGNISIDSNSIEVRSADLTTGDFYGIYYEFSAANNGGVGKVSTCDYNTITGFFNSSVGSLYGIYLNNVCQASVNCNYNHIQNLSRLGITSGNSSLIYVNSINNYNTHGYTTTILGNHIYNISFSASQTTGNIYALNLNGNYNLNIADNLVRKLIVNSTTANGSLYGLYTNYYSSIVTCTNNSLDSFWHYGTGTYNVYGIYDYMYYGSKSVYQNNHITNLKCSGANANLFAWYKFYIGGDFRANANKISGIEMDNSSVGNNAIYGVYGLNAPGAYGNLGNLWTNNIVSVGNSSNGVSVNMKSNGGVYAYYALNTYSNAHTLFNNTFYNFGSSVFANFNNVVIYSQGIAQSFDLRNNIFINTGKNFNASPNGKIAMLRLASALNSNSSQISLNSNWNNYFLSNYGSANCAYLVEGSVLTSSFSNFIAKVTPRETNSFSENTAYVSTNKLDSNFLVINKNALTQCEGGGGSNVNLLDDYFGNARYGSNFYGGTGKSIDVGAQEFEGLSPIPFIDSILFTPTVQQCNATIRNVQCKVWSNALIDSVKLKYSFNGVAQGFVLMSSVDQLNYTGSIPTAVPTNATVNFTVEAKNILGFTNELNGGSYSDAPYAGINLTIQFSKPQICSNDTAVLSLFTSGPSLLPQGYSASYASNDADEDIFNITLGNGLLNNSSTCTTTGVAASNGLPLSVVRTYSNYTSMVAPVTIQAGQVLPFSMSIGFCSGISYSNTSAIYLDLNRNGVFDLPTEQLYLSGYNNGNSINGASFVRSGNITIPSVGIVPGYTLMRIVVSESNFVSPVGAYAWGETEDYIVDLKGALSANYNWLDNGIAFGNNSLTQSYLGLTSGIHNISVVGTDSKGCTVSTNDTLIVFSRPALPSVVNGIHCGMAISNCYAISNSGVSSPIFNWYASSSSKILLQSSTNNHFATPFTNTSSFWVAEKSQNGCESQQRALVVDTVILPDTISLMQKNKSICLGSSANLSFSQHGTHSTNYNYTWLASALTGSGLPSNVSGGTSLNPLGTMVTPTNTGVFTYVLKGSNGVCELQDSVVLITNPHPVISFAYLLKDSICSNDSISLNSKAFVPALNGTTNLPNGYANSSAQFATHSDIYSFEMIGKGNNFSNQSACSGAGSAASNGLPASVPGQYANYTNISNKIFCDKGKTYPFSIKISNCDLISRNAQVAIFIDLDRNGSFSIPAEQVFISSYGTHGSINGNAYTLTDSFFINSNASIGYTLMRVIVSESLITSPALNYNYGETEDYEIVIADPNSSINYNWTVVGSGVISTASTSKLPWNFNAGNYLLNVTVSDVNTSCSNTSSNLPFKALSVPAAPSVTNGTQCGLGISSATAQSNSGLINPIFVWYSNVTTKSSLQDSTINYYAKVVAKSDTLFVTERNKLCEGKVRVPVILTVNPAPAIGLNNNYVLCKNEIRAVLPTTNKNQYNNFIWTSSAVLYADSLATIAYIPNSNNSTVYIKGDTNILSSIHLTAFNTSTGCMDTVSSNVKVQGQLTGINNLYTSICSPRMVPIGALSNGTIWNNLIYWDTCGLNKSYALAQSGTDKIYVNPIHSIVSRVSIKNDIGKVCSSLMDTTRVNLAQINSVVNGTRCGNGQVSLQVNADTSELFNWYSNVSLLGTPLHTGSTYSPYIIQNQNFYVQAQNGFGNNKYAISNNVVNDSTFGYLLDFDATSSIKIDSIYLYSKLNSLNHYAIYYKSGRGYNQLGSLAAWTFLDSGVVFSTTSNPLVALPIDFNLNVSIGNFSLLILSSDILKSAPGIGSNNSQIDLQNSDLKIYEGLKCNSGWNSAINFSTSPNMKFAGKILYTKSEPCLSSVAIVSALQKTSDPINITTSRSSLCFGTSDTLQVQSVNPNYSYNWSQGQAIGKRCILSTNNLSNTSQLMKVTVTGTDTSTGSNSGCAAYAQIMIPMNQVPNSLSLTPSNLATNVIGTPVNIVSAKDSSTTIQTAFLGNGNLRNTSSTYPSPFGLSNGLVHEQYLLRKSEMLAMGMRSGVALNSISFNVDSVCNRIELFRNYQIKLGHTTQNALTGLINTSFKNCYASVNGFNLNSTNWSLLNFDSVFVWNGIDNIVIDLSFKNCVNCSLPLSCQTDSSFNDIVLQSSTSFNSTYSVFGNNDCSIIGMNPIVSGTSFMQRPNMRITFINKYPDLHLWSPNNYIYNDFNVTSNYLGGNTDSVFIMPPFVATNPYVYLVKSINSSSNCYTSMSYNVKVDSFPLNYTCSSAQLLNINPTCVYVKGSSKWGWYDPSNTPTTPSIKTVASCGNADDDVWYKFYLPSGASTVTIKVKGGLNYDPAFELDLGQCAGFSTIACINNSTSLTNSIETYTLNNTSTFAGGYFYVRVYDARIGFGSGDFSICVEGVLPTPLNDNVCNAFSFSSNTAIWGGSTSSPSSYVLSSYDNGATIFMGAAAHFSDNPPSGVNCVFFAGSNSFASNQGINEPVPPCGILGPSPKTVWFKFKAPTMGGIDLALRTLFNGNPTNFNNFIAAYVLSSDPCTGLPTYTNIGCSTNGILNFSAVSGVLSPYAGQFIYVQLGGSGANSPTGDYMLSIQAIPQGISLTNPTTSTVNVNIPSIPGCNVVSIMWQKVGTTGYSFTNVSSSISTYVLTNLISGANYNVWARFSNASQSFYSNAVVIGTTIGCSANCQAPTIIPVKNHCGSDTIQWPAHLLATGTMPYRLYWGKVGASGYNLQSVPASAYNPATGKVNFVVNNLQPNQSYYFYYRVICIGGAQAVSNITSYMQCNGPAKMQSEVRGIIKFKDRFFVNADIADIINYSDTVTNATAIHSILWESVSEESLHTTLTNSENEFLAQDISFELIPNPASDYVLIKSSLSQNEPAEVLVMNLQGEVVKKLQWSSKEANNQNQLDLQSLESGVYVVSFNCQKGSFVRKLVIVH